MGLEKGSRFSADLLVYSAKSRILTLPVELAASSVWLLGRHATDDTNWFCSLVEMVPVTASNIPNLCENMGVGTARE